MPQCFNAGISKGLGVGFKLRDKDKVQDKVQEKDKAQEKDKDGDTPKEKELGKVGDRERESYRENLKELQHRLLKQREHEHEDHTHPSSGWTSILEDWYCQGVQVLGSEARKLGQTDAAARESHRAFASGDIGRKSAVKAIDHRKGPYELLIKERMMGIYLAIFVHRDARHLVEGETDSDDLLDVLKTRLFVGSSRSAVTAGLIGGRLGNKGGVGISVKIAGTTMLFINAHLAGKSICSLESAYVNCWHST